MIRTDQDFFGHSAFQDHLKRLYGGEPSRLDQETRRHAELAQAAAVQKVRAVHFLSVPGRSELGGNHTDHNQGRVLAAAVDLDVVAAVAPRNDDIINMYSAGYPGIFTANLGEDLAPRTNERGTPWALLRGVTARIRDLGHAVGGFDVWIHSKVLPGSGLSSSAAIEVLLGASLNHLYNEGRIPALELARIGQWAEHRHFGKPCGLMDQTVCALGGVVVIDFQDPAQPVVEKLAVDLAGFSHRLVIVDTGGSHADLTEDYAAIPREMRLVAQAFGMDVCRGLPLTELLTSLGRLRPKLGDRALLRALHFLEEDARVPRLAAALREGRFNDFLTLVQISGLSSHRWLQNIHPTGETREQGPDLALALVEMFLRENGGGACRIHGGGFAGTIQAWIPSGTEAALEAFLAPVLGPGRVHPLTIRQEGVCTF